LPAPASFEEQERECNMMQPDATRVDKPVPAMTACSWTPPFPAKPGDSALHVVAKELQNLRKKAGWSIQPV